MIQLLPGSSALTNNGSMTALDSPITEDFNTLATTGTNITWTDNSTIPGWYSSRTTYNTGAGTSNAGALYSFGTGSNTDRALGSVGSGATGIILYGARFINNTGGTITSLDISFVGEQWRNGGNASQAPQSVDFQYQVANAGVITGISSGTWLDFDALDWTSPINTATASALDGNAAANRVAKSSTLTVTVNSGQEVWLRWRDIDHTGNDHGLAVDDLSVTPHGMGGVDPTDPSGTGMADPSTVFPGDMTLLTVAVTPGSNPTSTGLAVTGDLSSIGGSAAQAFSDNGMNGDETAGDNTFSFSATVANGTTSGTKSLPVTITDAEMRSGSTTISLTVQSPPLAIHDIQGNGTSSPFVGQVVTTTGIVTGVKSNGFFIQIPDAQVDADPNTSEGIQVFTSSAPPAAAAIGNNVTVTGTVTEFIPAADPNSPSLTEITSPTVTVNSMGNPLPAAITLTMSDVTPGGGINQLEKFEGMRVHINSLTTISPTQGNKNEANATATTNGVFYGVLTGTARPFREAGVEEPDPLPVGSPANIPRYDGNPERIRIDSDGQVGATAINVTSGVEITNITGPFDYSFRTFTILPDAATPPTVGTNITVTPVPVPAADEFTVASFNMERFYDDINDSGGDAVLTTTAYNNRLNKASLTIRNILRMPDIIGIQEMEKLSVLQTLASKINMDAVSAGAPNPNYQAFLAEGNDPGGIDVAFLVKSTRVTNITVTQEGLNAMYTNPSNGQMELLNDRPPLVLTADITNPASSAPVAITVIVNHLRSLIGVDDPADGNRVRTKRRAQAEFLANLIQARQAADPDERIISVGDYNAFQFNDGYVDLIGTIRGVPTPADQVVLASSDLVNPDLIELLDQIAADQRYSFTFDGSAQTLDHELVTGNLFSSLRRLSYGRVNADFPEVFRSDPNRPEKLSDHDPSVAYFAFPAACSFTLDPTSGSFSAAGGSSSFTVTTQAGCAWTASPSDNWITINSGGSGTGDGTVNFTVEANPGPARSGTITVNGDTSSTFTINQATGCTFMIDPTSQNFPAAGGSGTVDVTAPNGCSWTASTTDMFITITSGSMGSGNGSVGFDVASNPSGPSRSGSITIAGQTFTVTQDGAVVTFAASGTVTLGNGGDGLPNVRMTFTRISGTGAIPAPVTTDGDGNWSQTGFETGSTYRVTPTRKRFTFTPASSDFSSASSSLNFSGTKNSDTTGVFRPSAGDLYLKNSNSTGFADLFLTYGLPGDIPLTGDWDGDGIDTIGVYRNGTFFLRNSNTNGFADITVTFGIPGDMPIVGDWDGDGDDTIGIYRGNAFMLRNSNTEGPVEIVFGLGVSGDVPISGDWDGDGIDTAGVFRPSDGTLFLKNTNSTGVADLTLTYGIPGDLPITGDWNADGVDTIGVYRNGNFLLRNSNTTGFAEIAFTLGINSDQPVKGDWNGLP